jgi:solute carrier family 30 (zinc transporter), member 5/7
MAACVRQILRHVLDDTNSRKIFIFLSINIVFMVVETLVGIWTNSLGLISDAGHMFFDNASLMIGLYASYMSKWRKDEEYTYGSVVLHGFLGEGCLPRVSW